MQNKKKLMNKSQDNEFGDKLFEDEFSWYGCPDGSKFNENLVIKNSMEKNCLQWN